MATETTKKEKTGGQRLVWWGWLILAVPIIGFIITFLGHTVTSLIFNIIGEGVPGDPLSQVQELITSILQLLGISAIAWILALGPFGVIFLIIGYIKRWHEKRK